MLASIVFTFLLGLAASLLFRLAWERIAPRFIKNYSGSTAARWTLVVCAADAFLLLHLKGLLLWMGLTLALWPVLFGLYCLIRYRPHWFTIWSVFKAVFAVAISPFILLVYAADKASFVLLMSALWPHLDIYTPEHKLYLRRWFMTPKGQSYRPRFLHLIMLSDEGRDPHDHPGAFSTTILMNGYDEHVFFPKQNRCPEVRKARAGITLQNPEGHTHMVKLIGPTLSWVVGWKKGKPWGFWKFDPDDPSKDTWTESEAYGEKGEERKSWTWDGK